MLFLCPLLPWWFANQDLFKATHLDSESVEKKALFVPRRDQCPSPGLVPLAVTDMLVTLREYPHCPLLHTPHTNYPSASHSFRVTTHKSDMGNVSSTTAKAFEFKAPSGQITFDFWKKKGKEHEQGDNQPDSQAVIQQATATTASIPTPTVFPRFPSLAPELQQRVWIEAMRKPGLHFLALVEPGAPNAMNDPDTGLPMLQLMEPSGRASRVICTLTSHWPPWLPYGEYYTTYFPEGMKSAYFNYRNIMSIYPWLPQFIQRHAMIRPLTIPLYNGRGPPKEAIIDAATDLVYIKFRSFKCDPDTSFMGHPVHALRDFDMNFSDISNLEGIRHVVLEMPRSPCLFWNDFGFVNFCSWCGFHIDNHESRETNVSSRALSKAGFLQCLPDLESVYLIFPDLKQGPVDLDVDKRYTVTGYPEPLGKRGTDARRHAGQERWESSADPVFRCDGGALRELRGAHIILPLAEILETFQHYYVGTPPYVTINGQPEPVGDQTEFNELIKVKFKFAVWVEEEE
jgi:hypothetical protein